MRHLLFNNTAVADAADGAYNDPNDVPKGQIEIFDAADGESLDKTGANATDKMIIAQGVADGKFPVRTHILEKSKIEKVVTKTYEAPVKQKTIVGFDGANYSIDRGAGEYLLKVIDVTDGYQPEETHNISFVADADNTEYEIARELAKLAAANDRFSVDVDVLVNEATSQLQDDTTNASVTLAVTKGEKVVKATVTSGEDILTLTAGGYIRIGHATDDAYPLYGVTNIETNGGAQTELEITLDRVYAGEDDTGVAAGFTNTDPAADDAAGLTLTGATPSPYNEEGIAYEPSKMTSFRTALSEDFGDTEVTASTAPKLGSGSYDQVSKLEKETQASEGFLYRVTPFQAEKPEFFADSSLTYDLVTILYRTNTTENIAKSNKYVEIVLAYQAGVLAADSVNFNTFFGV